MSSVSGIQWGESAGELKQQTGMDRGIGEKAWHAGKNPEDVCWCERKVRWEETQLDQHSGGGRLRQRQDYHHKSGWRQTGEWIRTRWSREWTSTLGGHIIPWVSERHSRRVKKLEMKAAAEELCSNGKASKQDLYMESERTWLLQSSALKIRVKCLFGNIICCRLSRNRQRVNVDQIILCSYWLPCFQQHWV